MHDPRFPRGGIARGSSRMPSIEIFYSSADDPTAVKFHKIRKIRRGVQGDRRYSRSVPGAAGVLALPARSSARVQACLFRGARDRSRTLRGPVERATATAATLLHVVFNGPTINTTRRESLPSADSERLAAEKARRSARKSHPIEDIGERARERESERVRFLNTIS